MLNGAVRRFNSAAAELQTEFRRPRTPPEWQRMAATRQARDYAKLLDPVVPLIEAFAAGTPGDRARECSKLNPDALYILRTFAFAMPMLAVRRESPTLITQGLKALAILAETDDFRDLTFYLATLHHSAIKLGLDARQVFGDAACLVSAARLREEMRSFPLRSPETRDLSAFGFRETLSGGEYDLVQDPWETAVKLPRRP
jgi:hypothetical protein